jgi:acyl carrier protein
MNITEFLQEVDQILEAEPGTVAPSTQLRSLDGWDSLAIISFIAMADSKLGVSVGVSSLAKCNTVDDLAKLCQIENV